MARPKENERSNPVIKCETIRNLIIDYFSFDLPEDIEKLVIPKKTIIRPELAPCIHALPGDRIVSREFGTNQNTYTSTKHKRVCSCGLLAIRVCRLVDTKFAIATFHPSSIHTRTASFPHGVIYNRSWNVVLTSTQREQVSPHQ